MERDLLDEILEKSPRSIDDLEKMSLGSILIIIGAYIAVGLGFFHFLINSLVHSPPSFIFQFFINFFFGLALILSYVKMSRDDSVFAIFVVILSIVLITLGGPVGTIAGLITLLGSIIALFTSVDPHER